MSSAPTLRDLQRWLKWIVTDPRGVREALGDPSPSIEEFQHRYTAPTESQLQWIGDEKIPSIRRLDVYAEGYFFRILECLSKDFPKTKRALGDDSFSRIVSQYLKAFPSQFSSIDEVGCEFARFVSEQSELPHEWVPDVARLEWSQIEAFYARETAIIANWWERANLDDGANLCFQVHPSVQMISSRFALPKIFESLDSGGLIHPTPQFQTPSYLIVYRHDDFHCWDEVEKPVFEVLLKIKSGQSLDEATSKLGDEHATEISNAFSRWVGRGILCGVSRG